MVKAININFDNWIYEGESLYDAMDAVQKSGFETVIYIDNKPDMFFSPICGWRHL